MLIAVMQYLPNQKPKSSPIKTTKAFQNDPFRTKLNNAILIYDLNDMNQQHFLNVLVETLSMNA